MRHAVSLLLLSASAFAMTGPPSRRRAPPPRRPPATSTSATPAYPVSERQELVETQFGVKVADPYRWLENDVREDAKVARLGDRAERR